MKLYDYVLERGGHVDVECHGGDNPVPGVRRHSGIEDEQRMVQLVPAPRSDEPGDGAALARSRLSGWVGCPRR